MKQRASIYIYKLTRPYAPHQPRKDTDCSDRVEKLMKANTTYLADERSTPQSSTRGSRTNWNLPTPGIQFTLRRPKFCYMKRNQTSIYECMWLSFVVQCSSSGDARNRRDNSHLMIRTIPKYKPGKLKFVFTWFETETLFQHRKSRKCILSMWFI